MTGIGIDSRENLSGKSFIAIKGQTHDGHDHLQSAARAGAALLIVERQDKADESSISLPPHVGVLHVEDTRRALAKLALAYRRTLRGLKVIAVTGSSGKTTTKRFIDAVLSTQLQGTASPKSFNNDIGLPLTILQAQPSDKFLLVEIGMNAPGEISQLAAIAEPDLAVITSIGRAHLQGLGSIEAIAQEKASILRHRTAHGVAIINADVPLLRPYLKQVKQSVLFGEAKDAELRLTRREACDGGQWFEINNRQRFELLLPGKHNALNALAAVAVARRLGLDDESIAKGLKSVEPDAMRMALAVHGEVAVYNDAYNANPDSMIAALATFAEITPHAKRRILVLGDMLELGDASPGLHREIGRRVLEIDRQTRIDSVVFIGEQSGFAAAEVAREWTGDRVNVIGALDEGAAKYVAGMFRAGDVALIKASRGMGLERVVQAIEQRFTESNDAPAAIASDLFAASKQGSAVRT